MYANMSQKSNKSHGIVVSFYHAIHSLDWFKCLQKKEEVMSVFIFNSKAVEVEKMSYIYCLFYKL